MKYLRPEIVATASASHVIQGSTNKGIYMPTDSHPENATSFAYEADE